MAVTQSNAALSAPPLPVDAPPAGVVHVRHRHSERFTVVGNHLAQHPTLSAVAIGLAVHIQSLPDGAPVTVKALAARFPEGEITVRRAMRELEAAGYLERRRVPLGGGRFATRAIAYDRPGGGGASAPGRGTVRGARPAAGPRRGRPTQPPSPAAGPRRGRPTQPPSPAVRRRTPAPAPLAGPAADLLARLRLADPRLLLPARDIAHLAPQVDEWLTRGAAPSQVTQALTSGLPPGAPIHHPARFLEHRLTALLPPPLPPAAAVARPAPLHTCEGCDRAFRTHDPTALCADCRAEDRHAP